MSLIDANPRKGPAGRRLNFEIRSANRRLPAPVTGVADELTTAALWSNFSGPYLASSRTWGSKVL